ncbi:hypothetical protein [Mycobacteroides abscessus]|uniref:hypothetical protein n=1 Tax=Mycobacteroides abscessus TaxID=36809 RepID=UPI0012FFF49A|nr:hypothetical protein [Mycobacteroides abscessus]
MGIRRVQIDLNERDEAGHTPASYYGPMPWVGEKVLAFEPESGVCLDAKIVAVDDERCEMTLDIDWDSMRDYYGVAVPLAVSGATGLSSLNGLVFGTSRSGSSERAEATGNYSFQVSASA